MELTKHQVRTIAACTHLVPDGQTIRVSPVNKTGGSDYIRVAHKGARGVVLYRWLVAPDGTMEKDN